jgi:hypothetical protein
MKTYDFKTKEVSNSEVGGPITRFINCTDFSDERLNLITTTFSAKRIEFSETFNDSLDKWEIMNDNVTTIIFGRAFDQALPVLFYASNIKVLRLGDGYTLPLEKQTLPVQLLELELSVCYPRSIESNVLPDSLLDLSFLPSVDITTPFNPRWISDFEPTPFCVEFPWCVVPANIKTIHADWADVFVQLSTGTDAPHAVTPIVTRNDLYLRDPRPTHQDTEWLIKRDTVINPVLTKQAVDDISEKAYKTQYDRECQLQATYKGLYNWSAEKAKLVNKFSGTWRFLRGVIGVKRLATIIDSLKQLNVSIQNLKDKLTPLRNTYSTKRAKYRQNMSATEEFKTNVIVWSSSIEQTLKATNAKLDHAQRPKTKTPKGLLSALVFRRNSISTQLQRIGPVQPVNTVEPETGTPATVVEPVEPMFGPIDGTPVDKPLAAYATLSNVSNVSNGPVSRSATPVSRSATPQNRRQDRVHRSNLPSPKRMSSAGGHADRTRDGEHKDTTGKLVETKN